MTTEYIEKFWRDATAADVVDVMNGGRVKARVRNHIADNWRDEAFLDGWIRGNWTAMSAYWTHCQVYSPPQYWLDKPEPGEGFRLLAKFPDEALQRGDEAFDLRGDEKWEPSFNVETGHGQAEGIWYRRRIEQPKHEPKLEPKLEPKHFILQVGDTAEFPGGVIVEVSELRGIWIKCVSPVCLSRGI